MTVAAAIEHGVPGQPESLPGLFAGNPAARGSRLGLIGPSGVGGPAASAPAVASFLVNWQSQLASLSEGVGDGQATGSQTEREAFRDESGLGSLPKTQAPLASLPSLSRAAGLLLPLGTPEKQTETQPIQPVGLSAARLPV